MPNYEAKASGAAKKEAKKNALHDVCRQILKDGYGSIGFKDPNFLIRISEMHG